MKIPAKAFTHGGKFHADDVFSAALLRILRPDIRIQRGFEVPENFDGLVFDIGDGMFDHHSADREVRPNGVPYAAFGLLWRVLGAGLVGDNQARLLDENFIQPLDLNDNTGEQDSLADAIGSFNPRWDEKTDPDECFFKAVDFAQVILQNRLEEARAVTRADDLVQKAYQNMRDGIVVLPCYAPWKKRAVPQRCAVCGVSQPAGRLGGPVRERPAHQKPQGALPGRLGRPARRRAGQAQRPGGPALLPRQPLFDLGLGQGDRPRRLPSGAGGPALREGLCL